MFEISKNMQKRTVVSEQLNVIAVVFPSQNELFMFSFLFLEYFPEINPH